MKRRVTIMMVVLMTAVVSVWAHGVNVVSGRHLVRNYQGSIMSLVDPSGFWHNDYSYGDGQYFTDIRPSDYTIHQASRRLYGMPFNTTKMQYYLKLDVRGIDLINTAPHIYLHPSSTPLNIQYRITEGGISIFKIKF